MSGAQLLAAARPVRALLLLVAFAPWWCNAAPLLARVDGRLIAPASALCGPLEWAWAAVGCAELLWLARGRRWLRRAVVALALLLVASGLGGGGRQAARAATRPLGGAVAMERLVMAPLPWSPGIADPAWLADPTALREWSPSARHWLGTDPAGYDLAARLLHALRASLAIAVAAAALAMTIGIAVGVACGTLRGAFDLLAMRGIEILLCFPHFFLVLVVLTYLPRHELTLIVLIGATAWTGVARLVRGEFMRLAEAEFVLAARALGASRSRIAWRHLLPNSAAPLFAAATFAIAGALLAEFSLSWLGLGVERGAASLGTMLAEGQKAVQNGAAPRLMVVPAGALAVIVIAFHAASERLRRAATPGEGPR